MKTQLLTLILGVLSLTGLTQELVSSSGDHFDTNGLQLDFSIGEAVTETFESGSVLTQGFHQTLLTITNVVEAELVNWQVGPNPVSDVLNIQFQNIPAGMLRLEVLNMQGQIVMAESFSPASKLQLDFGLLASGVYLLKASNLQNNSISQSLLIQKL